MLKNLNIYFSDACNLNCQYCVLKNKESNNITIQQALENNTFVTFAREALTEETISISFLGKEPTINGQYFASFITNILDYSPYIQYIILPTNGQTETVYSNFIIPLYNYCNTHKRKIVFCIQFSLDGPPDLHDKHYGIGSSKKCLDTINYIFNNFNFKNKYLRLYLSTKSILTGYDIEHYSPTIWLQYMDNLVIKYANINVGYFWGYIGFQAATIEIPGNYTVTQGQALTNWKNIIKIGTQTYYTCTTDFNSKTIDYLGNLYDCHLLVNKNITQEELRAQFETTMDNLVSSGEAIEQDRNKLFNAISSVYCWGAQDKNLDSYIRLLGNGFLL